MSVTPDVKGNSARDFDGFSTAEFKQVFWKYLDCDFEVFAERIKWHERDLKNIVVEPKYAFVGMTTADEILLGLDQNVQHLINMGELHPVPARDSRASAMKMIMFEHGVEQEDGKITLEGIADEEIEARIRDLLHRRRELCVVSDEQRERLRRDAERVTRRREREKEQEQGAAA